MRILAFLNNQLGADVFAYLADQMENIAGLVLHPEKKRKAGEQILEIGRNYPDLPVFDGSLCNQPSIIEQIKKLDVEIGISILFGYKLGGELLSIFSKGVINLHPSLLPYNRGAFPNVWAITEGTPAGVSLHYMDESFDTGDLIAQREVCVNYTDTGKTLYEKLEKEGLDLFKATWPLIKRNEQSRKRQNSMRGTEHRIGDVSKIDYIELDKSYTAREIINILRARTFPPHKGAYIEVEGKRIYLSLKLEY